MITSISLTCILFHIVSDGVSCYNPNMTIGIYNQIINFIWRITDDCFRYIVAGKVDVQDIYVLNAKLLEEQNEEGYGNYE